MTAQASDSDRRVLVRPAWLEATVSGVFTALGFDPADSTTIAAALVEADLRGVSSHGVMLVPTSAATNSPLAAPAIASPRRSSTCAVFRTRVCLAVPRRL